MPLKTVYVLGQARKSLPGNRLERQSPDVEVQKITLTHWRIFFVFSSSGANNALFEETGVL